MHDNRIVALVDMDCFYCQVEARLNPDLQGRPMAVVQYNAWKGGGIIAVNYEARDRGVTRHMRGDEAKKVCPEIELVRVASVRGKADLTKYREASREVFNVICQFSKCVQRASIDEAYIDLTEAVDKRFRLGEHVTEAHLRNSFIVGYSSRNSNKEDERAQGVVSWLSEVYDNEMNDSAGLQRLALGALIVEEMRTEIFKKTNFRCSAGIAQNKIMAKLVAGLHKPNRQTVLPSSGIAELFKDLPVHKVRNLGGKFGNDVIERLGCKVMADLLNYSVKDLQTIFDEKTGTWLYNIARGIDLEPVTPRLISKSIGCCKQFRGIAALKTKKDVLHWINELSLEIAERLDEDALMNKRRAQLLTVSIQQEINKKKTASSRSVALPSYESEAIANVAFSAIKRSNSASHSSDTWVPPLLFLGISVGKFTDESSSSNAMINHFFKNNSTPGTSSSVASVCSEKNIVEKCVNDYEKRVENKMDSKPIIDESNQSSKGDSFFERYFKSKNFILTKGINNELIVQKQNVLIKKLQSSEDQPCSSNLIQNSAGGNSDVIEQSSPYFDNQETGVDKALKSSITSDNVDQNKRDSESTNFKSDDEASWLSPSELFPDPNNIDKDVLSMLPIQLQKKVLARSNQVCDKKRLLNVKNGSDEVESDLNFQAGVQPDKYNSCISNSGYCSKSNSRSVSDQITTVVEAVVHQSNINTTDGDCKIKRLNFTDNVNLTENLDKNCCTALNVVKDFKEKAELQNYSQEMFECSSSPSKKYNEDVEISSDVEEHREIDEYQYLRDNPPVMSSLELCTLCKENIPVIEYQEHMDHHIAVELHQKLNSNQEQTVPNYQTTVARKIGLPHNTKSGKTKKGSSPTKRKRGLSNKKPIGSEGKKPKSILSYFAPK